VGLAKESRPGDLDPAGAFVQLEQQLPCSPEAPGFSASVRTVTKRMTALAIDVGSSGKPVCSGAVTGVPELWHHVTLRRQTGLVSVRVAGRDSCGELGADSSAIAYSGPLDDFVRVMIGRAPGGSAADGSGACDSATAALSIDNLVLRTLPCPPDGQSCTEPDTGQTVCVDLGSSPEHCGACFTPVGAAERCVDAAPRCAEALCTTSTGSLVCADLQVDPHNCGACNQPVGPLEECGSGYARAASVELPQRFTIDATEVTRSQYQAWLSTGPSAGSQSASCAWNTSFTPTCEWPPAADEGNFPVQCVDWCDAYAYCAGVGKRLCGQIGGGPVGYAVADTTASQWVAACSADGVNDYPYGNSYEPKTCNGQDNKPGGAPFPCATLKEAGAMAGCQSSEAGYAGVFDLSGNLYEWLDSCTAQTGDQDLCHSAGGSTCRTTPYLDCTTLVHDLRSMKNTSLGFRCCRY
jgi:formylglycine-generating enzyme